MPRSKRSDGLAVPIRVFISYAHDDARHKEQVLAFWRFLRANGIDARLDAPDGESPQDWPLWMLRQIRAATYVLIIASPSYKSRAEGESQPDEGRGVKFEASLIRNEFYANQEAARLRFLPVVLPHCSASDIPAWLGGPATSHYSVSEYSTEGAIKLLRYLTGQPGIVTPPVGPRPVLPVDRSFDAPDTLTAQFSTRLQMLANRRAGRNDEALQADLRQLITAGPFGLSDDDLGAPPGDDNPAKRRRIEIPKSGLSLVVCADLRETGGRQRVERDLLVQAEANLRSRLPGREIVIVTDGTHWLLYRISSSGHLDLIDEKHLGQTKSEVESVAQWLDTLLTVRTGQEPTPDLIRSTLGAESPLHTLDFTDLAELYAEHRTTPSVTIKRQLWGRLLTTALGTNFVDDDSLFINHTLLVLMAEIIGSSVIGIPIEDSGGNVAAVLSGDAFTNVDVYGVVEPDFFDWIVEIPEGEKFVSRLAGRLARFDWRHPERDLMRLLYESIIDRDTRHRLGEYYTPDWLAQEVLEECVDNPLHVRVLDASCGSGTFLFHSVKNYLSAAERSGISLVEALDGLATSVIGIDVHPVAVTLARVTYLLAIGVDRVRSSDRGAISVPVYLGDSLRWGHESTLLSYEGLSVSTSERYEIFTDSIADAPDQLRFPSRVVDDVVKFDQLVSALATLATSREPNSDPASPIGIFDRLGVVDEDRSTLVETYLQLCRLHDSNRDHIWSYYVRNLARPLWLSRPQNQVDVLVGNPPWLAFRYMTQSQKATFRRLSRERGLVTDYSRVTNQDLSALFVVRCIEQYLKPEGRFGFVLPLAALSRGQYEGFRAGRYSTPSELVTVHFDRPWDLGGIRPSIFPVKPCVVFGVKKSMSESRSLSMVPEMWVGRVPRRAENRSDVTARVSRAVGELSQPLEKGSPYRNKFDQGATLVPRVLVIVEPDVEPYLGSGPGRVSVRSLRSPKEKRPWRELRGLAGAVERQFVRRVYSGDAVYPFMCTGSSSQAIVPWHGGRLLGVLTRDVVDGHAARRVIGGRPPRAEWARRVL